VHGKTLIYLSHTLIYEGISAGLNEVIGRQERGTPTFISFRFR